LQGPLIAEALRLGHHRSKAETVAAALEEYVRLRKRQDILCVYGDLEEEDGS
jgi:putative antitoxin of VapBC-like toxin-antitoxin system